MKKGGAIFLILLVLAAAGIGIGVHSYLGSGQARPSENEFSPVKYMLPEGTIYAGKGEKKQLTVCALDGSKLSVKLGTKEFKAKKRAKAEEQYSLYSINCVFPSTQEEIQSIGRVRIVCEYKGEVYGFAGAAVTFEDKEAATTAAFVTQIANAEAQNDANEFYKEEQAFFAEANGKGKDGGQEPKSGQMCRVIAERADTWPGDTTDDIMNPMYSSLPKGTMAFIAGTSSAYDSDKEDTRYFYDLACGRRVQQSDVQLVSETESDTEITATAGVSDGKTVISIDAGWNVPFGFSLSPVKFFTASGKTFNVSSFDADEIEFTFFNTVKAAGNMDFSGSDIIKNGKFSVDAGKKTAKLSLKLRSPGGFYGYSAEYVGEGRLQITFNRKPVGLSGAVIVLDPGHGGKDSGALGYYGQVKECDINFAESVALKGELERRGATVHLTRYSDDYYTLNQRREYAYSVKPDVFVSIHSNSSPDKSASGTAVYYYKPMSYPLARGIYDELASAWEMSVYPDGGSMLAAVRKGCNYNPFAVTRIDDCPSVLVELGFVSNDVECAKLCNADVRQVLAEAITDGIEKALTK